MNRKIIYLTNILHKYDNTSGQNVVKRTNCRNLIIFQTDIVQFYQKPFNIYNILIE